MEQQDYKVSITVDASAEEVFKAINNITGWWSTNFEGQSEKLNNIFTVRFGKTFITIQLTELIPYQKIGWQVIDCYKHWIKNKKEWLDTTMIWDISSQKNGTQINFTHVGLVPGIECYNGCEGAWNDYIKGSLFKLITEGNGKPS